MAREDEEEGEEEVNYVAFVACAIQDQTPGAFAEVDRFVEAVEESCGRTFYAARMFPDPAAYPSPGACFELIKEAIASSRLFVLYYPDKVPSGALVELGMAIGEGRPAVCYTRDPENLSFFLRDTPRLDLFHDPGKLLEAVQRLSRGAPGG